MAAETGAPHDRGSTCRNPPAPRQVAPIESAARRPRAAANRIPARPGSKSRRSEQPRLSLRQWRNLYPGCRRRHVKVDLVIFTATEYSRQRGSRAGGRGRRNSARRASRRVRSPSRKSSPRGGRPDRGSSATLARASARICRRTSPHAAGGGSRTAIVSISGATPGLFPMLTGLRPRLCGAPPPAGRLRASCSPRGRLALL